MARLRQSLSLFACVAPFCSVPSRASRRPLTPNQHDTAQVTLIECPLCFHNASQFPYACMRALLNAARTHSERRRMCLGVCRSCMTATTRPFTDHALVMRQTVFIALHAALVQRRKACLRNAATQGVALSSSTSQGVPPSGPDCGPTLAAGAAAQEPLARHGLRSLCSESRTGRVRQRLSVPDEHV